MGKLHWSLWLGCGYKEQSELVGLNRGTATLLTQTTRASCTSSQGECRRRQTFRAPAKIPRLTRTLPQRRENQRTQRSVVLPVFQQAPAIKIYQNPSEPLDLPKKISWTTPSVTAHARHCTALMEPLGMYSKKINSEGSSCLFVGLKPKVSSGLNFDSDWLWLFKTKQVSFSLFCGLHCGFQWFFDVLIVLLMV